MRGWLSGLVALAGLTVREAQRQRLWTLFLAGMAVLVVLSPSLKAAAAADRLKLAITAQSGVVGFVAVLLAILIPAAALRRDLEARTAFMLFAKPLSRSAYLLGRWSGVQLVLLAGTLLLCLVGTATVAWQFGGMPQVRRSLGAGGWEQLSAVGQAQPITEDREQVTLTGVPGNGVRWHFTGLPTTTADQEVLIKVRVRGFGIEDAISDLLVQVAAGPPGGAMRVLELDPASPYGAQRGAGAVPRGQAVVRDRDAGRSDLSTDYLRLRLPASCVVDGGCSIVLTRLEARAAVVADRQTSCLVAVPGTSFFGNLLRGSLMQLAGAGLLIAWSLLLACVASLGVALLGGITLFIGGVALPAVREALEHGDASSPLRRVMELIVAVFPDFNRFGAAERLAAGEEIPWAMVGDAWWHAGGFMLLFLAVGWWALRRREL